MTNSHSSSSVETSFSPLPADAPRRTRGRLLEAIAIVEVVRDLLLAEEDGGSKRIALDGAISMLYGVDEDLDVLRAAADAGVTP